jgi:hypothetical protein
MGAGDPKKDEKFKKEERKTRKAVGNACMAGAMKDAYLAVETFRDFCLDPGDKGKNIVMNLGQHEAREGFKSATHMISDLTCVVSNCTRAISDLEAIRGSLYARADWCNEQGRSGLATARKKLESELAGRQ